MAGVDLQGTGEGFHTNNHNSRRVALGDRWCSMVRNDRFTKNGSKKRRTQTQRKTEPNKTRKSLVQLLPLLVDFHYKFPFKVSITDLVVFEFSANVGWQVGVG